MQSRVEGRHSPEGACRTRFFADWPTNPTPGSVFTCGHREIHFSGRVLTDTRVGCRQSVRFGRLTVRLLYGGERIIGTMTDDERIARLERRVRELQTAVVAIIEHLEIVEHVEAAEQSRSDKRRFRDDVPRERLIELYGVPPLA